MEIAQYVLSIISKPICRLALLALVYCVPFMCDFLFNIIFRNLKIILQLSIWHFKTIFSLCLSFYFIPTWHFLNVFVDFREKETSVWEKHWLAEPPTCSLLGIEPTTQACAPVGNPTRDLWLREGYSLTRTHFFLCI